MLTTTELRFSIGGLGIGRRGLGALEIARGDEMDKIFCPLNI